MSTEITQYVETVNPTLVAGETMEIVTPDDLKAATEVLSQVNKVMDHVKEEKDKVLGPLKLLADTEKARWEPLESRLKPIVARLRVLMSSYQTEALRKKKEEDEKILARTKEGKGNFTPETAIRKMSEAAVDEKVEAESGGLSFREKKVLKITDKAKIPKIYWVVDEDAVFAALKGGVEIEGAEIEIQQTPINRRN